MVFGTSALNSSPSIANIFFLSRFFFIIKSFLSSILRILFVNKSRFISFWSVQGWGTACLTFYIAPEVLGLYLLSWNGMWHPELLGKVMVVQPQRRCADRVVPPRRLFLPVPSTRTPG